MTAILDQLGLDQTFFIQLGVFALLFFILANFYFRPFLKLFEARHKRTVEDREAAEKLMVQAHNRFEEYKNRLAEERLAARKEYESIVAEARNEESTILAQARDEAKRVTQDAAECVSKQRDEIKKQLEGDVEELARNVSEALLVRKE